MRHTTVGCYPVNRTTITILIRVVAGLPNVTLRLGLVIEEIEEKIIRYPPEILATLFPGCPLQLSVTLYGLKKYHSTHKPN